MTRMKPESKVPIFNAPASVVRCLALLAVVHVLLWHLLPAGGAADQIRSLVAFNTGRFSGLSDKSGLELGAAVWSFLTHQLMHGDATHLLFNSAALLIFGGGVAARIGGARFLGLGLASGIAGALVFLAVHFGSEAVMYGASGAVSGLTGGAFRFFFSALNRGGFARFRDNPKSVPLMTVREALADRRFQLVAGAMVLINILTAATGVAWESHLGGFLFGFLCFDWFEPRRPRLEIVRPTLH